MAKLKPKIKRRVLPVKIVGDSAIAIQGVGEGRMIPLIIVDSSATPAIDEMIQLHKSVKSGDVVVDWGRPEKDTKSIFLVIMAKRPIEAEFAITFEVSKHLGLVDQIITANGLYLQTGKEGDRFSTAPHAPRVLIEVDSDTTFASHWEKLFPSLIAKQMRQEGHSRREAANIAKELVVEWRRLGTFRLDGHN